MFSKLTRTFECDIDLTVHSCKRVSFVKGTGNMFTVKSYLRMPRSCMCSFVERLIRRRVGEYKFYSGNASKPEAYFYHN